MLRLPAALERRLAALFPRIRDREKFVVNLIESALDNHEPGDFDRPESIGGTLNLYTDGGSRGNPGQAAIACVLEDPSKGILLKEYAEVIGIETNNVAEYRALIEGLRLAQKFHPNKLVCHVDSELIVRQLNGTYRVKMEHLKQFVDEAQELAQSFPDITFVHIPREDNHRADALVNKALDNHPAPRYGK
ncbi:hypothetical protein COU77_01365 [Candidatus Peregrinibacteria bacterium CG10_big_fil_rev_8_21_14_0_10_49_16]|nr:MAG: hypothetical protein COW95_01295 [Candidatus Peregrinibacteria bacterium CG22_combo_CG10-13_8_21_14_all_49_11]PIR52259.1 MAG: hypothetical protein COU77_01365 [Candidatus Peregrinibacteria bacterium CG10_big_fil_rev_8_21_14_0_10_49_16]